ncbi:PREDICTED: claspin [Ceratosolen solmsi marchali]|uniref:Claspin n=1 Tax=Ceratosolen solmsi marchali TaxID=326594 RepID=A0AAJ6YED6_9HYME|nr:PREDICTED: claspin [Ceratosolen solmsi marchali]
MTIKTYHLQESVRVSKELAMQKIHSETQRLMRESEVSLPYHRPKQRSLQEFLSRKKMMSEIPTNLTCAEKVKMFPEIISKVVEEKEKEAEIFYKSSDSEEDEKCIELKEFNQVNVLNDVKNKSEIKNKDKSDNKISIANTQKLTQYGIQESHIKGEIVVQQSLHFGASKKIFMDDMKNTKESKSIQDNLKYLREFFTNNSENMDISIDSNQCILEENVLNISETEIENNGNEKVIELSTVNDLSFQSKNQETILETSIINNKTNTISRISVNVKGVEQETVNFNQSKQISETNLKSNEQKNCNIEIVDHDDTDFSPGFKVNESSKKSNMKEKILANILKLKPIIKGSPGSIIDFTGSKHMNEGVAQLLNRFAQHSIIVKPKIEGVTKVKIMNTEREDNNTKIKEETLLFKKTVVKNEDDKEHKPGEKLKKLREDLKRRIAYVRHEEWKKKEEDEKEDEELKDESDSYYAGLPDEEELLEDDESSESEPEENDVLIIDNQKSICEFADEEAEESDHEYIGNSENEKDNEKEQEEEVEVDDHDKELKENEDDESLESEDEKFANKPTKLKRIMKSFEDDSNQLESSLSNDANSRLSFDRTRTDEDMFASQTSNSYASEDIDGIPPFQPRDRCSSDSRSQACKTPLPKPNNILSMISPVAQLTVLNASLDSAKKSASKTDSINFGQVDKSCLVINTSAMNSCNGILQNNSNLEKMIGLPKKLFDDPPETVNDDELVDICSGKFIETQNSERVINERNGVTDTQLMELCSGAFISQPVDLKKLEFKYANSNIHTDDTSQDITLTFDDEDNDNFMDSSMNMSSSMKRSDESMFSNDSKSPVKACTYSSKTSKSPMETWLKRANENMATIYTQQQKQNEVTDSQLRDVCSGVFMSQPIDMKELEQNDTLQIQSRILQDFKLTLSDKSKSLNKESNETNMNKKKLESLLQQIIANEKEETAPWSAYMIVSSDDDNLKKYKECCMKTKKKALKKRKKVQKLILSDDEENKSNEFSEDEEDQTIDEEDQKYIEYDSDENEIVVVNKKEIKKVAANFLEKEAELSESDWDSADEDEQDMDKFEYEEGDMEKIDENKMKKLLDKIHIKQIMDRDQREVKILQEFLFDDGDLHNDGISRERRFKWKNIDNFDDNLIPTVNDDDEIDDNVDAAVEAQMRKIRYEQQKFLEEKEKNINQNAEKDFEESHSCKLGLKVISVRSSRKSSLKNHGVKGINLNTNKNFLLHGVSNLSSKISTKFKNSAVSNIRGSFLSRGEETLVRIAQNLPETNKKIINPLRNRKFVFEHVSPSVSNVLQEDLEQKNDTTLIKEKKKIRKRKMFSSQTPKTTKKLKVDDRTSCKQLF